MLEEFGIHDHGLEPEPFEIRTTEEEREEMFEFGLDYDQEESFWLNRKKKHRYCRIGRFKMVLFNLLSLSGRVSKRFVPYLKTQLKRKNKKITRSKIWNQIRAVLKKNKLAKYYNRIPFMIKQITGLTYIGLSETKLRLILEDFQNMHKQFKFGSLSSKWSRSYFPNLRFIALTLLRKHGVEFPYKIPFLRTTRKRKTLEVLLNDFEW